MQIRVVTWNMGFWQFRKQHDQAWEYLRNEIKPDVALLQECRPPDLSENEHILFEEIHHGWGTAVYLRYLEGEKIIFTEYPHRAVGAKIRLPGALQWRVASIHAPIINGRVFPHMDNIFSEIENIFGGLSAIVGGDLNSARLAEKTWPGYGHGPFFERVDRSWLVDCRKQFYEDEIQTIFRPRQKFPFQDDHIFVSKDLANKVVGYKVLHNETTRSVSDHIPVVVELEL